LRCRQCGSLRAWGTRGHQRAAAFDGAERHVSHVADVRVVVELVVLAVKHFGDAVRERFGALIAGGDEQVAVQP
jgi:hypothetical protein